MDYLTHNETETEALGARLAGALSPGAVVAYRGGLGMGKTAFTRVLARGWDMSAGSQALPSPLSTSMRAVSSPCFTLTCTGWEARRSSSILVGRTIWTGAACALWSGVSR